MRELTTYTPLGLLIAVLLLTGLGTANARTCEKHQFWSSFYDKCANCTTCVHPDIVITPCQGHRDTVCGPLSDLKIDWSWMRRGEHNKNQVKEMTETFQENMQEIKLHENHVKEKERMLRRLQKHRQAASDAEADLAMIASKHELWNRLKAMGRDAESKGSQLAGELFRNLPREHNEMPPIPHDKLLQVLHFDSDEAKDLLNSAAKNDDDDDDDEEYEDEEETPSTHLHNEKLVKNFGFFPVHNEEDDYETKDSPEVSEKEIDFSTTERMVLDYQAGVLYIALASIVIFFLVALCYSLKHLRTWGRYNYREDLEELKSWIWAQSHKSNTKPMASTIYKSTTEVVSKEAAGNCKYLERIISKNAKRKMNRVPQNVYHGAHPSIETRPLTASTEELEVHKPTCV